MHIKKLFGFLLVSVIGVTSVFAYLPQPDLSQQHPEVSAEELEMFAAAFKEIKQIDQQLQEEMMRSVEEEGIDLARFNDYLETQQDSSKEFAATGQELEKFESVFRAIEGMHDVAEQEMQQVIVEKGLSVDRYQQITKLVQENPELLQKLQQHFQE